MCALCARCQHAAATACALWKRHGRCKDAVGTLCTRYTDTLIFLGVFRGDPTARLHGFRTLYKHCGIAVWCDRGLSEICVIFLNSKMVHISFKRIRLQRCIFLMLKLNNIKQKACKLMTMKIPIFFIGISVELYQRFFMLQLEEMCFGLWSSQDKMNWKLDLYISWMHINTRTIRHENDRFVKATIKQYNHFTL